MCITPIQAIFLTLWVVCIFCVGWSGTDYMVSKNKPREYELKNPSRFALFLILFVVLGFFNLISFYFSFP